MSEDTDRSGIGEFSEQDPVSRRGFLVCSSVLALGEFSWNTPARSGTTEVTPAEIILTELDLAREAGASYVDRSGDPTTTPLVRHLSDSVPGFSAVSGAVSGFVAGGSSRRVPLFVESAAFDAASVSFASVAEATDGWIRSTYGRNDAVRSIDAKRRRNVVSWTVVTQAGWEDSLQLHRVGEFVLFTVAYGRQSAKTRPSAVVERAARIMRSKAA